MADLRLTYELQKTAPDSQARAGLLHTRRGTVQTPVFMPVGTQATVRGMYTEQLDELNYRILLANTYHLLLRVGPDVFRHHGGIHNFMQWKDLVLTDSGGFQIFSLPNARRIEEEGAAFKSYIDGKPVLLTPESSIDMQRAIDSDIMMVLDECVPSTSSLDESARAMHLTHRWALRSYTAREDSDQALFGIVQGACHESLRRESAEFLTQHPFDGFAIGGLAVGETRDERKHFTQFAANLLPQNKPRYLMGVGTPVDLLEAVHRGVDMFDCIIPSSLAQQGTAYTWNGKVRTRRGVYALDQGPIDPTCSCSTCSKYSRGYIHHLTKSSEGLGWRLVATHNFHFYKELMETLRADILDGTFATKYRQRQENLVQCDVDYPAVANPKSTKPNKLIKGAFEVVTSETNGKKWGAIRHRASTEIMHPTAQPDVEAQQLYVNQSHLDSMLTKETDIPLVVWDVGLGAGHNALAVINAWRSSESVRPVQLISFENDLDSFQLAARNKQLFAHMRCAGPDQFIESGLYEEEGLSWRLVEGDFVDAFESYSSPDVILFDPFSSKTNQELWSAELFKTLFAKVANKSCVLVTYSTSTLVRASMLAAGFHVSRCEGTGGRGEATVAHTFSEPLSRHSLLDSDWLSRWSRSTAAAPPDLSSEEAAMFKFRVSEHPQFS